jgi:hypothetical protein
MRMMKKKKWSEKKENMMVGWWNELERGEDG